jgi:hypothetical protein
MLGAGQSRSEGQATTIAENPLEIETNLIVRTKKGKYVLSGSDDVRAMIDLGRGRWRSLSKACTGSCDAKIFRGNAKLPAHRAELPGKEVSFMLCPLTPPISRFGGTGTFRSNEQGRKNRAPPIV